MTAAKLINLSSGYGSVPANTGAFPYYYSASKAALNMVMRSLAADLRRWGITTVVLEPGWVRTDMGGPQVPLTPHGPSPNNCVMGHKVAMHGCDRCPWHIGVPSRAWQQVP